MTAYLIARIILAGALIYLWRAEIPRELRRFVLFVAITVPPPGIMTSHEYRLYLWSPLRVVLWILAVRTSAELFRIATQRATFWWERVNFGLLLGVVLAILFVVMAAAGLTWKAANVIQDVAVANQYFWLVLTASCALTAAWFGWHRPIRLPDTTKALCGFWALMCACYFAMSTTGGGCFLFQHLSRADNSGLYWGIGAIAMSVQAVGAVWCGRKLR